MPEENYLYALPRELCEQYKIRRYGAHGTSHKYVSARMNEILGRVNTKLITCHIGNGASISAVVDGKCIKYSCLNSVWYYFLCSFYSYYCGWIMKWC